MLKRLTQTHDLNNTIKTGMIFSFFLFVSLLVTYPVVLKMKTHVYGTPMGDLFSMIWYFWWQKYALFHGMTAQFTPYVAAPFGVDFINWPVYLQPILNYPALILTLIFNEIFAYNALMIMSYFISAVTMYYLVYYLTRNRLASMASGFIFSFSPYHFSHALGHLNIVFGMQCLPLFVLAMLKLDEERSSQNMVFLAFAFSLVVLSDFYDGFFAAVTLGSLIAYRAIQAFLAKRSITFNRNTLKTYVLTSLLILFMILPFTFNILKLTVESRLSIRPSTSSAFYGRSLYEINAFSARPLEYVVPFALNPIFGKHTYSFLADRLHGSNFAEQSIFLGFIPLALALCAVMQWKGRKQREEADKKSKAVLATPVFIWIAIIAALFSFPPFMSFLGLKLPSLSFFTYKYFPMFRSYARFGVIVLLAVAVLAGIGLDWLLRKMKDWKKIYSVLLVGTIIMTVGVEFTNIPPFAVADVSVSPTEYQWLAERQGNFIIVEYPLVSYEYLENSEYLFYQRIHKKKLFNGTIGNAQAEALMNQVKDISNPQTASILQQKKVKYVVVHNEKFQSPNRPNIKGPVLERAKQFGDTVIYKIKNKPAESAILNR